MTGVHNVSWVCLITLLGAAAPRPPEARPAGQEAFEVGILRSSRFPDVLLVSASVNGEGPFDFLFDTGASMTVLATSVASELGIETTEGGRGVSGHGDIEVALGRIDSLSVGGATVEDLQVGVTAMYDQLGASIGQRLAGSIGFDFLSKFRLTFDFPAQRLHMTPAESEVPRHEPEEEGWMHFRLMDAAEKPLMLVPAFVNGRGWYTFVVDTGASICVIAPDVARELEIESEQTVQIPASGTGTMGSVGSMSVGATRVNDLTVLISDMMTPVSEAAGEELDGIVGMSFLSRFRLSIDYSRRALRFVAPAGQSTERSSEPDSPPEQVQGTPRLIHKIPKRFASVRHVDVERRAVGLLVEGEEEPATWEVLPDAEIRIGAWWGRLDQLQVEDRVWLWFHVDGEGERRGIILLTDELSEQDLHGEPWVVESLDVESGALTVRRAKDEPRTLRAALGVSAPAEPGAEIYLQATGDTLRRSIPGAGLEIARDHQRAFLRKIWKEQGLPATVSALHPFTDRMEVIVDHEGMRWSRALGTDDEVEIVSSGASRNGRVVAMEPWREKTRLRLIVDGTDQATLRAGQRVGVRVPEPAASVLESDLPPDIDLPRTAGERVEWFLASTYCTCSIANDFCTGMLYTLASCNSAMCGMPNRFRKMVGAVIDEGASDADVLVEIAKRFGELYSRPHIRR